MTNKVKGYRVMIGKRQSDFSKLLKLWMSYSIIIFLLVWKKFFLVKKR